MFGGCRDGVFEWYRCNRPTEAIIESTSHQNAMQPKGDGQREIVRDAWVSERERSEVPHVTLEFHPSDLHHTVVSFPGRCDFRAQLFTCFQCTRTNTKQAIINDSRELLLMVPSVNIRQQMTSQETSIGQHFVKQLRSSES